MRSACAIRVLAPKEVGSSLSPARVLLAQGLAGLALFVYSGHRVLTIAKVQKPSTVSSDVLEVLAQDGFPHRREAIEPGAGDRLTTG